MTIATWVGYPASHTAGRARAIQGVCVHYTAGSEGPTSAENGASYDKRRTDGTSTHVFADSDSVACEVPDRDRAHAARWHGNEIFLQLELCGTAQTRAEWLDPASLATLRNGAKWAAEKCQAYGIPVRRLTVEQTRAAYYAAPGARPFGIVGHVDATNAFPEDNGTHTDPGSDFPWDVFLAMVAEESGVPTAPPSPPPYVPALRRGWPSYMPAGHYFGLITGPSRSHGGYYASERADVQAIQRELIRQGYVPGITNPASGWADGKFEGPTRDAVARFQRARMPGTTFYGQVWSDDWRTLFTY